MNCRLCLIECTNEQSFFLFDFNGNNTWTHLIFKYLTIKIDLDDDYSTAICDECFRHLNDFHNFYEYIEHRQEELQNVRINRNLERSQHIKTEIFEETFTEVSNFTFVKSELDPEKFASVNVQILNEAEQNDLVNDKGGDVEQERENSKLNSLNNKAVLERFNYQTNINPQSDSEDARFAQNKKNKLILQSFDSRKLQQSQAVEETFYHLTNRTKNDRNSVSNSLHWYNDIRNKHTDLKVHVKNEEAASETLDFQDNSSVNDHDEDRTCIICNKMHKSFKGLQSHMYKIHNEIKPYSCEHCGLKFRFRPNYRHHMQEAKCTNRENVGYEDIHRRTCMICRKVHKSFQGLQSHIYRYHSGERPFVCNKCGVGFQFEQSLHHHLFKEKCGKVSKQKTPKIVDRNKDRTCGICNRRFKNVDALSSHMYISHKGAKPFGCKTCGLKFRMRGTFLRHFWKCSGTPPLETNQSVIENEKTESTENIEFRSCVLCARVFDDISTLYQHMVRQHESIKPFSCQRCGKCFVLKRALEKHSERNCSK